MFRLLRRYLAQTLDDLPVYVLSAEYGLIQSKRAIPYYDRRMTRRRAEELRPQVSAVLRRILTTPTNEKDIQRRIFISFGHTYHEAIGDSCKRMLQMRVVTQATGSVGGRLAQMHSWLYGSARHTPTYSRSCDGKVRLHGIEIVANANYVIEVAQKAIEQRVNVNTTGQSWYVIIGEHRVGVKRLVSLLTGLPVSSFHTDAARRVLSQLGVDVYQNVTG